MHQPCIKLDIRGKYGLHKKRLQRTLAFEDMTLPTYHLMVPFLGTSWNSTT